MHVLTQIFAAPVMLLGFALAPTPTRQQMAPPHQHYRSQRCSLR